MTKYDFTRVYEGLKDFQRDTVDYVFQRMYLDKDPPRRFLVADEVGLGKTLVARGVIARAIEHLEKKGIDRIDIVYICSNAEIARQNISRLNVTDREDFAFASRITLLAAQLDNLTSNPLNFVSFTPGTSFDLKSNLGQQDERKLLYWLLRWAWDVPGAKGPKRVFQGSVRSFDRWNEGLREYRSTARKVDPGLRDAFLTALREHDQVSTREGEETLRERFGLLSVEWAHDRKQRSWEETHRRNRFVGDLRNLLARVTITALEPDLVILDEFQRFKHLLDGDTPAAELAHSMFTYSDEVAEARVLLLSATPYKMYTLSDEASEDDHYADFVRTVDFLMEGDTDSFRRDLHELRRGFLHIGNGGVPDLMGTKSRVETQLRKVMARTERLAVTADRNGMLVHNHDGATEVTPDDLIASVRLQRAADKLDAGGVIEYWKSAPHFANFWSDYKIGRAFNDARDENPGTVAEVRELLRPGKELVRWADMERYLRVDPGNARLRWLLDQTVERDAWKLLWMPPSLPYYEPGQPFDSPEAQALTKRLVFSAWNAVPRSVSTMVSYEAQRRIMNLKGKPRYENTPEGRERYTEPLRFPKVGTGMSAFAFVYPSPSLARYADPLEIARHIIPAGGSASMEDVLNGAGQELMRRLEGHLPSEGPTDDRWYWAAPLVLDRDLPDQKAWLQRRNAAEAWIGQKARRTSAGFELHLDQARAAHRGELDLGRPPDDLGRVLALLAIGGPGNVALRSLGRITRQRSSEYTDASLRSGAAAIAWGMRSLYNTPEAAELVRGLMAGGPYWQKALRYGVAGNLQAVMDEFVHVTREWLGILEIDDVGPVEEIARSIADVVSMRSADLRGRDLHADPDNAERRMRSRFALPFGTHRSEEEQDVRRSGYVRAAFNSPFWPFVLTTTSVGQEGLDFHLYCHAVVHWNLPANPVDLEQREGRIHRYMGHAVRKNLAVAHADAALGGNSRNPWDAMLDAAVEAREDAVNDLVPFWVFDGPAKIERHVPAMPLSREIGRLEDLQRALAIYRLVFGQPRQEELLAYLERTGATEAMVEELRIDLSPPHVTAQ